MGSNSLILRASQIESNNFFDMNCTIYLHILKAFVQRCIHRDRIGVQMGTKWNRPVFGIFSRLRNGYMELLSCSGSTL